jgi:hypothetical protein
VKNSLGNWSDSPCFYVSIRDAGRHAVTAGPFRTHAAALAVLPVARELGYKADPWSHFYSWGTCKLETGHKTGSLNSKLAALDDSINRGEWPHTAEHIAEANRQESATVPA